MRRVENLKTVERKGGRSNRIVKGQKIRGKKKIGFVSADRFSEDLNHSTEVKLAQ